jgi:hypothetical protein
MSVHPFMGTRVAVMTHLMEHLRGEQLGIDRPPTRLVLVFKAAATGDRDHFEAVLEEHLPDEGRDQVRSWCEQIVFSELDRRALLETNPTKSKMPHRWEGWHLEIRLVLELLLGPPEGVQPTPTPRI